MVFSHCAVPRSGDNSSDEHLQSPSLPDLDDEAHPEQAGRDDDGPSFWDRDEFPTDNLVSYTEAEARDHHGWEAEEHFFWEDMDKETMAVMQFSSSANLSLQQTTELINMVSQVSGYINIEWIMLQYYMVI